MLRALAEISNVVQSNEIFDMAEVMILATSGQHS